MIPDSMVALMGGRRRSLSLAWLNPSLLGLKKRGKAGEKAEEEQARVLTHFVGA